MSDSVFQHKKHAWRFRQAGYGVLELAVVIGIIAILATTTLIAVNKALAHYRATQNARSLVSQIERARSLAIKYNQTLTLSFMSSNKVFGLTCTDCEEPKNELPNYSIPASTTLSAYPTLTIKGNGTIASTSATIVLTDGQKYQVRILISNSGRTTIGDVSTSN